MATVRGLHTLPAHTTLPDCAFPSIQEETEEVGMEEDMRVLEVADPGKQVSPPLLCSTQVPDSTVHNHTVETCN